ncbi:hypothetical protein L3Y34_002747 [Caenorhabditis briggsae]|uniref:Uncharacterized protein n=1 Tax=Caenorhabditis briggsae TaxID=6238 RepID=A0AAE9DH65_CAEBR|nr:hypothetical protein L3Y34_002747 [Caenorhabditis briggsae]
MDNLFDAVELMFDRDASDTQNFIGFKGTNDYLKVFEKKNLNASNMIKKLNLLETMLGLPGKSLIDKMNQWLDSLEKVKTQLAPVEKSINQISNSAYSKDSKNLILSLKEAKTLSQDIGANVRILEDAERIRQNRSLLTNIPQFPEEIKFLIYRAGLAQWADPSIQLKEMLGKIEKLERISGKVRSESVLEMTKIFEEAADITGISGSWTSLNQFSIALKESHLKDKNASMNYFSDVVSLGVDFEFSNHQTRLRTSRTIVLSLVQYFDEIFGHSKPKTVTIEKHVETASLAMIIGICIGIVFVILLATVVAF